MKCPIDGNILVISDRQGVEIDYCPECRGVWLDRGEIDKIIERTEGPAADNSPTGSPNKYPEAKYKPKRRESFLSDLLDFG